MNLEDMPLYAIIFIFGGIFGFFILLYLKLDYSIACTPSQEHQEVMSGINDIKQAFCNKDGCRLDYETYQEKTK